MCIREDTVRFEKDMKAKLEHRRRCRQSAWSNVGGEEVGQGSLGEPSDDRCHEGMVRETDGALC